MVEEEQVVVLTRTDSKGMSRPVDAGATNDSVGSGKRRKREKVQTHAKGERQRYFADDDKYDLKVNTDADFWYQELHMITLKVNSPFGATTNPSP